MTEAIVQNLNFDAQKYGMVGQAYNVTMVHNTAKVLPMQPETLKKPYAVLIIEDGQNRISDRYPIGFAWDLDGSGRVSATVQLASGGSTTLDAKIVVLYRK